MCVFKKSKVCMVLIKMLLIANKVELFRIEGGVGIFLKVKVPR